MCDISYINNQHVTVSVVWPRQEFYDEGLHQGQWSTQDHIMTVSKIQPGQGFPAHLTNHLHVHSPKACRADAMFDNNQKPF